MTATPQPLKRSHARPQPASCWRRVMFIGIFVLSLAMAGQAQTTGARNSKSVLFLSPYQIDLPVNTLAVQAIRRNFSRPPTWR